MSSSTPNPNAAFAARLERLMAQANLNGLELAAKAAVDKGSVVRWRKGRVMPQQAKLAALAEALGVPPAALLTDPPPAPASQQPVPPPAHDGGSPPDPEELVQRLATLAETAMETLAPDLMAILADARAYARSKRIRPDRGRSGTDDVAVAGGDEPGLEH